MFRHNLTEDIGQAFVELALVLPIFLLLLVGAVEVGRLAYAAIEVSNAARAGVSYAAQSHTTASTDPTNIGFIKQAASQDAPNITILSAVPSNSCSCESSAGVFTTTSCTTINTTNCASPSRIVEYVQVQTSAQVDTLFHFPGIPNKVTLGGYANMRVQQ
jgi:Flp pilus assembly protein TadG